MNKAIKHYENGYNCAQSLLRSFAEEIGMNEDFAAMIGAGLDRGMRCQGTCGCIIAAQIIIGGKFAPDESDMEGRLYLREKLKLFKNQFKKFDYSFHCIDPEEKTNLRCHERINNTELVLKKIICTD